MEAPAYTGARGRLSNNPRRRGDPSGRLQRAAIVKSHPACLVHRMIKRGDILYLGLASGVIGCLVGGMMLGVGMSLIIGGAPIGWLLLLPAAPVGGIPGWVLAKRLAKQLPLASGIAHEVRHHVVQPRHPAWPDHGAEAAGARRCGGGVSAAGQRLGWRRAVREPAARRADPARRHSRPPH